MWDNTPLRAAIDISYAGLLGAQNCRHIGLRWRLRAFVEFTDQKTGSSQNDGAACVMSRFAGFGDDSHETKLMGMLGEPQFTLCLLCIQCAR